jgi:hypothetical protein
MATKAERYRAEAQRRGPRERPGKNRATGAAASKSARKVTGTELPGGVGKSRTAKNHLRRAPRAVYELEESDAKQPSRKSSRKSGNRQKAGAQLKAKKTLETIAPRSQHGRQPRGRRR